MTMRECLEDHKKRVDKGKKNMDKKQKILIVDDAKFIKNCFLRSIPALLPPGTPQPHLP